MYLTEWYFPDNFENMPDPIKLYHGTKLDLMDDIVETGVISAKRGGQHGETFGINWFTINPKVSFGTGTAFSIEVPKSEFENGNFLFENGHEVTSRASELPIEKYNMKIEKIDGIESDYFIRVFKMCGNDIWEFENYLCDKGPESHTYDIRFQLSIPSVRYILEQEFGKDITKPYHDYMNMTEDRDRLQPYIDIDEVNAEDVNLQSFEVKNELQPDIWVNGKINSDVRKHLLDIADDFIDELEIRWVKPKDIIITGSLANYNWSEYSDIDLHIVMKFSDIHEDVELLTDYFKAKKDLWNEQHKDLTIFGFPVEIYVQDTEEPHAASGIFSLLSNEWLVEPKDLSNAKLNKDYIKDEAAKIMTKIDDLYDSDEDEDEVIKKAEHIMDYAKDLRKKGLATDAMEMSSGNIIWKTLRREGYIERLADLITLTYDKINSLD